MHQCRKKVERVSIVGCIEKRGASQVDIGATEQQIQSQPDKLFDVRRVKQTTSIMNKSMVWLFAVNVSYVCYCGPNYAD
jgi:hypothetical protein